MIKTGLAMIIAGLLLPFVVVITGVLWPVALAVGAIFFLGWAAAPFRQGLEKGRARRVERLAAQKSIVPLWIKMACAVVFGLFVLLEMIVPALADTPSVTEPPSREVVSVRTSATEPTIRPIQLDQGANAVTQTKTPDERRTRSSTATRRRLTRVQRQACDSHVEGISDEQLRIWRRLERPIGTPFRNFVEDRYR